MKRSFGDSSRFIVSNLTVKTTPLYDKPKGSIIASIENESPLQIVEIYDGDYVKVKLLNKNISGYVLTFALERSTDLTNYINAIVKTRLDEWRKDIEENHEKDKKISYEKRKASNEERRSAIIKKYGASVGQKIINKEYWLGMTTEQARDSQGSPDSINESVGSWGVKQQWVYYELYLYFENGVLKSYQKRF